MVKTAIPSTSESKELRNLAHQLLDIKLKLNHVKQKFDTDISFNIDNDLESIVSLSARVDKSDFMDFET